MEQYENQTRIVSSIADISPISVMIPVHYMQQQYQYWPYYNDLQDGSQQFDEMAQSSSRQP